MFRSKSFMRPRRIDTALMLISIAMVIVTILATSGCTTNPRNQIGQGYIAVQTIANSIATECGNLTPRDPCVSGSLISTAEAARWKRDLSEATSVLDAAASATAEGNVSATSRNLSIAQGMLRSLRRTLIERGVD